MSNKTMKFHDFKLHNYLQKCSFHVRQRITVIFVFNFQKFSKFNLRPADFSALHLPVNKYNINSCTTLVQEIFHVKWQVTCNNSCYSLFLYSPCFTVWLHAHIINKTHASTDWNAFITWVDLIKTRLFVECELMQEISFIIKLTGRTHLHCLYLLFDNLCYLKSEYRHHKMVFVY